jgi:hypothetical protein
MDLPSRTEPLDPQGDFFPSLVTLRWTDEESPLSRIEEPVLRWLFDVACAALGYGPRERTEQVAAMMVNPKHLAVADVLVRSVPRIHVRTAEEREFVAFAIRHLIHIHDCLPFGHIGFFDDGEKGEAARLAAAKRYGTREELAARIGALVFETIPRLMRFGRSLALGYCIAAAMELIRDLTWADRLQELACISEADPAAVEWLVVAIADGTWPRGEQSLIEMYESGPAVTRQAAERWLREMQDAWKRVLAIAAATPEGFGSQFDLVLALEPRIDVWTSRLGRQLLQTAEEAHWRGCLPLRDGRFYFDRDRCGGEL